MPAGKTVNDLGEQKRLLLLESNLHRTLIRVECATLNSQADNLKNRLGVFRNVGALFGIANPTSAQSITARAGSIAAWAALGISAWKLWRTFNSLRGNPKEKLKR
jgi:hypothetical protein